MRCCLIVASGLQRPDSPYELAGQATPSQDPALPPQSIRPPNPVSYQLDAAPTTEPSVEEIGPVPMMGAADLPPVDLPRPMANLPVSMAKVHRVNKVLKAAMEHGTPSSRNLTRPRLALNPSLAHPRPTRTRTRTRPRTRPRRTKSAEWPPCAANMTDL